MQRALISLFSSLPLAICGFLIPLTAQAQEVTTNITPDETLPNPTQVNHNDNTIEITGGTRTENGNNLFHSFGNFSVGTGDIASFQNVSDIANILSRVTGGNISEIDGIIRTVNSNANLYLINPNGIIFGENARLNLGGSFFASTADSLLFEDNAEFSASNPQAPPLLEVSIPIGINFRDNPGDIVNRSNLREIEIINQGTELEVNRIGLEVNQGQNITLIGGNILLEDTAITAPGGRVDLGGLSAAGEIGIHPDGSLSFPDGIARANVTLNNQAKVNVSAGEGGFININARNLTLTDESLLLGGIAKNSDSVDAQAGDITINTTSIVAKGNSIISTATNGMGNAGNINITTNTLEFNDEFSSEELAAQFFQDDLSSRLVASTFSTFGQGNGGNITVNAAGDVSFDGSGGGIFSTVGIRANDDAIQNVKGNAGNILVNANSVSITNGAGFIVSTIGEGNGGNITVNARETVNLDGLGDPIPKFPGSPRPSGLKTQVRGQEDATADKKEQVGPGIGNGGVIEINTNVLSTSRVNIQADTNGIGNAGDIIINAESITLEGIEDVEVLNSLLLTQVQQNGQGEGGDIEINTKDLKLVDSFLLADNKGQGDSGQITINATNSISLEDTPQVAQGSQIVSGTQQSGNETQGNAGNITITTGSLSLQGNSFISTEVKGMGMGDAGDITIISNGSLSLQGDSYISTQVNGIGNAGDININASSDVSIKDNSRLATQILSGGMGNSGEINIDVKSFTIHGVGSILADNKGAGDAGNVTIDATDSVVLDTGEQTTDSVDSDTLDEIRSTASIISQLQNSNVEGKAGNIAIYAPQISLNNFALISTNVKQGSKGKAGNITINTDTISLDTGSVIDALTESNSNGGNINIEAKLLKLSNGGKIVTAAQRDGNAGNITLNITGDIILNKGNPPPNSPFTEQILKDLKSQTGLFANNFPESTGDAGNIKINANSIKLTASSIETQSFGRGDAGDITIKLTENLILSKNSLISSDASKGAKGGDLTIKAQSIIALPSKLEETGNDIITKALPGKGGEVNIDAELVGIQVRPAIEANGDRRENGTNDLDLRGNPSDIDPSGLIELPEAVVDATDQVSENICEQGVGSEFIITGKGGLPPNLHETLNSDEEQIDLVEPVPLQRQTVGSNGIRPNNLRPEKSTAELVPAQGWIFNDNGEVTLTSYETHNTEIRQSQTKNLPNCSNGI